MLIKTIIQLLDINNNIELIGTNSLQNMKYTTDYDLQEHVKIKNNKDYSNILKHFQDIYLFAENNKDVFVTDFKAGVFNTYPVRWNYESIKKGYQDIDTKHIDFVTTLYNKNNTVKIDLIVLIDDEFTEFSCNYYFSKQQFNENIITLSLMLDIQKYYHERKYMKMLKRIISYRQIKKQNNNELISLFNSETGRLYQINHKLDVILFVIEKNLDVDNKDINNQLKILLNSIPKEIKIKPQKDVIKLIKTTQDLLTEKMNQDVIEFIEDD